MNEESSCGKIVCLGSMIMDISVGCRRLPNRGETLYTSEDYQVSPGGKGANQAIAAARLGGNVKMLGRAADDVYGQELQKNLKDSGIDTSYLCHDETGNSGVAFVWIDENGNNQIICSPGVHLATDISDIEEGLSTLKEGDILLMTMEFSEEILLYAAKKAKEAGAWVVVDPSALGEYKLNKEFGQYIDLMKPNEIEAELFTGIKIKDMEDAKKALQCMEDMGITYPLISLGENGVLYQIETTVYHEKGISVKAVDTTAAGDTFLGATAARLSKGASLQEAIVYGNKAAAVCVQKRGAQISIPFAEEVIE